MEFKETEFGTVIIGLDKELNSIGREGLKKQTMGEAKRRQEFMKLNGVQPGKPMQLNVDLSKAEQRQCACGCKYFQQAMAVFTVSALMSPTGKELPVQVPHLICLECKMPLPPSAAN